MVCTNLGSFKVAGLRLTETLCFLQQTWVKHDCATVLLDVLDRVSAELLNK